MTVSLAYGGFTRNGDILESCHTEVARQATTLDASRQFLLLETARQAVSPCF